MVLSEQAGDRKVVHDSFMVLVPVRLALFQLGPCGIANLCLEIHPLPLPDAMISTSGRFPEDERVDLWIVGFQTICPTRTCKVATMTFFHRLPEALQL